MKRVLCLVASSLLTVAISVHALPGLRTGADSPTRSFSLNGRWYSVGERSTASSLLREEVRKRGLAVPESFRSTAPPDDGVVDVLTELPADMRSREIPLPTGFRLANILRMESGGGSIDIAGGKISSKGNRARKALSAAGWDLTETEAAGRSFCIGTLRKGGETTIVFLEEKGGNWLFLRRREK